MNYHEGSGEGGNGTEEMEFVVKLRGIPWSTTVDDVLEFFGSDCQILGDRDGVHLVKTAEGRATGECFVEMLTLRDVDEALRKDHQHMGHRYVEVFKVKKVEMDWILKRARPEEPSNASNGSGITHTGYGNNSAGRGYGYGGQSACFVRLRGLPFECTKEDIMQFFSGLEVAPNGIQLVVDSMGKVTGEAYCQFTSPEGAEMAMTRNLECIGHRYVEIFRVTPSELRNTIDQLVHRTQRHYFGSRPCPYDRPPQRDSNPNTPRSHMQMGVSRGGYGGNRYFNRNSPANNNGGGRYGQDGWNNSGTWNRNSIGSGGRNSYQNQTQSHPPPLMPGLKGQGGVLPRRMMGEFPVLMRGLPWSASEADIRNFFAPVPVRVVQIMYDDTSRPSGSARAFFGCVEDQTTALQKHKNLMGSRYIELFRD